MSGEDRRRGLPSELRISETWDSCIENALIKTTLGLVAGGAVSLILFRLLLFLVFLMYLGSPTTRALVGGFSGGVGGGLAWNDCRAAFARAGFVQLDSGSKSPAEPGVSPAPDSPPEEKKHE